MTLRVVTGFHSLTAEDAAWADRVAVDRNKPASERRYRTRHGTVQKDSHADHRIGAGGELAFARLNGLAWPALVNTFKPTCDAKRDVPPFEVRTRRKSWHDLMIRETDPDAPYALMIFCGESRYKSCGYIWKSEVEERRKEFWKRVPGIPEPAFFVAQEQLHTGLPKDGNEAVDWIFDPSTPEELRTRLRAAVYRAFGADD